MSNTRQFILSFLARQAFLRASVHRYVPAYSLFKEHSLEIQPFAVAPLPLDKHKRNQQARAYRHKSSRRYFGRRPARGNQLLTSDKVGAKASSPSTPGRGNSVRGFSATPTGRAFLVISVSNSSM